MAFTPFARVDFNEMAELQSAIEEIRRKFDPKKANTKLKQISRRAVNPLRKEMRDLAPVHKNNPTYKGKKYYWYSKTRYKYESGTLKRSVGTFTGKSGIFVGPRFGRNARVKTPLGRVGDPKKDGWYAHLAAYPHQIKNSKKGQSSGETQNHISPMFIEKARLRKRVEVLDRLLVEAKNLINFKK